MSDGANTPTIVTRGVGRFFGEHHVLDHVDLAVAEGTIFSLLGPTGAGKPRSRASSPPANRHPRQSRSAPGRKLGDVLIARPSGF